MAFYGAVRGCLMRKQWLARKRFLLIMAVSTLHTEQSMIIQSARPSYEKAICIVLIALQLPKVHASIYGRRRYRGFKRVPRGPRLMQYLKAGMWPPIHPPRSWREFMPEFMR